jgi:uncharacterized protein YecE (DUF72 family)
VTAGKVRVGQVRVGTSGWTYKHWRGGAFYPPKLPAKRELEHYAGVFDCAEINGSFYRLPSEAAVASWRERAPEGFLFAWKVPRFLTHYRRLKDAAESVALIFDRMSGLGEKAGPALFQLPPQLKRDDARLAAFLPLIEGRGRCVFEFRDPSWYAPEVFDLLRRHDAAFCVSDHAAAPAPWEVTAPFAYVRGHGPGGRYWGRYEPAALQAWAEHVRRWRDEGRDVFNFFDNDIDAAAPVDALALRALF